MKKRCDNCIHAKRWFCNTLEAENCGDYEPTPLMAENIRLIEQLRLCVVFWGQQEILEDVKQLLKEVKP